MERPSATTVVVTITSMIIAGIIGWQYTRQSNLDDYWNKTQDGRIDTVFDRLVAVEARVEQQNITLENNRSNAVESLSTLSARITSKAESFDKRLSGFYEAVDDRTDRLDKRVKETLLKYDEKLTFLVDRYLDHTHRGLPSEPPVDRSFGNHPRGKHMLPYQGGRGPGGDREIGFADWAGKSIRLRPHDDRDSVTGLRRADLSDLEPRWLPHRVEARE